MIITDQGNSIYQLLLCSVKHPGNKELHISVPFFDGRSRLWKLLEKAAENNMKIRLLTRSPREKGEKDTLYNLLSFGKNVRAVLLDQLHAKTCVVVDFENKLMSGWIGSNNFTLASENKALELGVGLNGRSLTSFVICQKILTTLNAWEHMARFEIQPKSINKFYQK